MSKRAIYVIIPLAIIIILVLLIVVASGSKDKDEGDKKETVKAPAATQAVAGGGEAESGAQTPTQGQESQADTSSAPAGAPRVIAWEQSAGGGRLVAYEGGAMPQELHAFAGGNVSDVKRCGHDYRQPNGVLMYVGGARGDLVYYPLDGSDAVVVGQTARLTCAGPDTVRMFGDGNQVAYIRFDGSTRSFRAGNAVIYDRAQGKEVITLDYTAAIEKAGSSLLLVRMFPNGEGNADEASLDLWSNGSRTTLAEFKPLQPPDEEEAECIFTSGTVAQTQQVAYVAFGERCDKGGSRWRVVAVPLAGGGSTEIMAGAAGGDFYADNFSVQVFAAQDNSGVLMAVPSGMERHVVRLFWLAPDGTVSPVADYALADRLGDAALEGQQMQVSPDGRWLAYVELTLAKEQTLKLIDLATIGGSAVELVDLGPNETVNDYRWGAGGRLFFVTGNNESGALRVVVPGSDPQLVLRGRFSSVEPDAAGQYVAVAEWVKDPEKPDRWLSEAALVDLTGNRIALSAGNQPDVQFWVLGVE